MKFQQHIADTDISISEQNNSVIIKYANEKAEQGKYHSLFLYPTPTFLEQVFLPLLQAHVVAFSSFFALYSLWACPPAPQ